MPGRFKLKFVLLLVLVYRKLVSDNSAALKSEKFEYFMAKNGIHHLTTAPYHTASNGLAERAVHAVKQGLLKQTQGDLIAKPSRFLLNYLNCFGQATALGHQLQIGLAGKNLFGGM